MPIGIDSRLNADVLYMLRAMGYGDALIIAGTNFPAIRSPARWLLVRRGVWKT